LYVKLGYKDIYKRDYINDGVAAGAGGSTCTETETGREGTGTGTWTVSKDETAQLLSDECAEVTLTAGFDILMLGLGLGHA